MSEGIESLVEKTEKTIEGIVYASGVYFRTLAALAFPFFLARQFFLRLHRLRKRKLQLLRCYSSVSPPLYFRSP
ncbi:MAG: hypothetical protein ND866_09535 [Pyrinomonadaceae bacterium]|nr:hypothetical protein [Pyrinomonadaceae bacterium]